MRLRRLTLTIALGAVVASLALAAPAGAWVHHVQPGESIQAAIDAAKPGETIFVAPGVYRENLTITQDDITLIGAGARESGTVLMPADTPTPSVCTQDDAVNGICVIGEVDPDTGEPGTPVSGVTIKGFLIDGFSAFGVFAFNANDLTVARTRARNNDGYGISGFVLSGVRFLKNVAHDNGEPGLYIGDSPEANAQVVGNTAFRNGVGGGEGFGILIRDSNHGSLRKNHVFDNCAGVIFIDTGENPDVGVSDWEAWRNRVTANNGACPGDEEEGIPPFSGTGILLGGTNTVTVKHNLVLGNRPTLEPPLESPFSGGVVVASTSAIGGADPTDNLVKRNVVLGNQPADLIWDETGTGNVFADNLCDTSQPDGLCD